MADREPGRSFPLYYGWINVAMAAIAMTATLPGRTHGLSLIEAPLTDELSLSDAEFGLINLVSSLAGALFCLPVGWLIDRYGVRSVGTIVTLLLAVCVWQLSRVTDALSLLFVLTWIRGLGQSALSIISIAMIGKWFRGRLGVAMGVFTVLLTFGFIGTILGFGGAVPLWGWRRTWQVLALSLLGCTPILWLFTGDTPERSGVEPDPLPSLSTNDVPCDYSLQDAVQTPAFWILCLGTSAFNLVWSSITLFNEKILGELGFAASTAVEMMAFLTGAGLLANLIGGRLATRERSMRLLAVGLSVLAGALFLFPQIRNAGALRLYGSAMGIVGGIVTVVHFAAWAQFYGREQLGRIQGAVQIMSVLASAFGPLLMAWSAAATGSRLTIFPVFAVGILLLAVATWCVPLPPALQDRSRNEDLEVSVPAPVSSSMALPE